MSRHEKTIEDETVCEEIRLEHSGFWAAMPPNQKLKFKDCIFKLPVTIKNFESLDSVEFEDCAFENSVAFIGVKFSLTIKGCAFLQNFISDFKEYKKHSISKTIFRGECHLCGSATAIHIKECNLPQLHAAHLITEQKGHILLNNLSCPGFKLEQACFDSLKVTYQTDLSIAIALSKLDISNLSIKGGSARVSDCKIGRLDIDDVTDFENTFLGIGAEITDATVTCHGLNKMITAKCVISHLKIVGTLSPEKQISITSCRVDHFFFLNLINRGTISLSGIRNCNHLTMRDSAFGKLDVISCDFSKAKFSFTNSKLTELFIVESDFPELVYEGNQPNYKQAQLAFGQINSAFQKQGDTIRALEYQAREIESHYKELRAHKNCFNVTTWALWLNRISNDFGRNWGLGFLFTIAVGILSFYGLVLSTPEYSFGFPISLDIRLWSSFMKFMNPLRFFEAEAVFKNGEKSYVTFGFWSYLFDFLGRIAVAYGVYQTIQAFRRYGRK